jgi:hypothetical protein
MVKRAGKGIRKVKKPTTIFTSTNPIASTFSF